LAGIGRIFSIFVVPDSLAPHFPLDGFALFCNCLRQWFTQVEVPASTIVVDALKAKQRFALREVEGVFSPVWFSYVTLFAF
jgi:hypothetical protein